MSCASEYSFQTLTDDVLRWNMSACGSTSAALAVWAWNLPVAWRTEDFTYTVPLMTPAAASVAPTAAVHTPAATGQLPPAPRNPGLAPSAVAAIASIVPAVVIATIALVFLCCRRRRRRGECPSPTPELDGTVLCEIHADAKVPAPVELEGFTPDVVQQGANEDAIARLRREQDAVGVRLERMRKMEQLEDEHRRLGREISERVGGRVAVV